MFQSNSETLHGAKRMHGDIRGHKIVIHIGAEKTGTTSVQSFLSKNRDLLQQRGIVYPLQPAQPQRFSIVAYAGEDHQSNVFRRGLNIVGQESLAAFRESAEHGMVEEFRACKGDRLLLSSELCHSRLVDQKSLWRLANLCKKFTSSPAGILFYIRRQDLLATSLFSTLIKVGASPERIFPRLGAERPYFGTTVPYYFDFHSVYLNWASVFGSNNVAVRVYDQSSLVEGDVISDFCWSAGIDTRGLRPLGRMRNASLSCAALGLIYCLNGLIRADGGVSRDSLQLGKLIRLLLLKHPGRKFLPKRARARAFLNAFSGSNRRLWAALAPDSGGRLFDEGTDIPPREGSLIRIGEVTALAEELRDSGVFVPQFDTGLIPPALRDG